MSNQREQRHGICDATVKGLFTALRMVVWVTGLAACGNAAQAQIELANRPELTLQVGHRSYVTAVAFSPDGLTVAGGYGDGTVKLWNARTGALRRVIPAHKRVVWSVAFSGDGLYMATGSGWYEETSEVSLWDAHTGRLKRAMSTKGSEILSLTFMPDHHTLMSNGADAAVRLWDMDSGKLLRSFPGWYVDSAFSVAFTNDKRIMASGSEQGTIKVRDTSTQALLHVLRSNGGWVWSVAFSPDGKRLVSGSNDGMVKVWDVNSERLLATMMAFPTTGDQYPDWIAFTVDGYYESSGGADRYIRWQTGGRLSRADRYAGIFHRPDMVRRALR